MITWSVGRDREGAYFVAYDNETYPYRQYGHCRTIADMTERVNDLRDRQARGEDISAEEDRCNQTIAQ